MGNTHLLEEIDFDKICYYQDRLNLPNEIGKTCRMTSNTFENGIPEAEQKWLSEVIFNMNQGQYTIVLERT